MKGEVEYEVEKSADGKSIEDQWTLNSIWGVLMGSKICIEFDGKDESSSYGVHL